jgi:predicted aldo/keto reductase-like oxidoreductase
MREGSSGGSAGDSGGAESSRGGIRRRDLLRGGVAATLGAAALPLAGRAAAAEDDGKPRVRSYRRLGRTGLEIPDIGFGSSRLGSDEDLVRAALERGVTYFDTAESYRGGRSETTLGRALKGSREKVVIASKTSAGAQDKRDAMMGALEGSLKRLQTDRIDIYFNHAVNEPERMSNSEWQEFVALARKQGKIRFTGMSGHAGRLIECLDYALDHDLIDVMLVAYNFGQDPAFYSKFTRSFDFVAIQPDLPRVIHKAKQKNVGVIAMKTLMGGRLNDMKPYQTGQSTYAQAAFRWVLANPEVDALIVSMTSREELEEYLGASGSQRVAAGDLDLLERYAALHSGEYCRLGCNLCVSACPEGVPISEVLRTRMYAVDYRDLELAQGDYRELAVNASACASCSHLACAGRCPYGLDIARLTRDAHARLSVA